MWGLPPAVRIYCFSAPVDLRKGPDGLRALIEKEKLDVYAGHLFVFIAKKPSRAKILWWDGGGFVIWYKRLEKGCFKRPEKDTIDVIRIDAVQLSMLLDGIDLKRVKRPQKWIPKTSSLEHF